MKTAIKRILCVFLSCFLLFGAFGRQRASAADVRGEDVIAYARSFIGYPYQYGSAGPNAFDCSGLAVYVFKHFGIDLPHGTQYFRSDPTAYGTLIGSGTYQNAQAGDIVVWDGHMGFYTAEGTIVEALNRNSGVVERFRAEEHPSGRNFYVIRVKGVSSDGALTGQAPGDANGDGKVTSKDARLVLRASARLTAPSAAERTASDVNGDGKVTSKDARLVLRASARLISLTGRDVTPGDVNADGKITSKDARVALRASAKLISLTENARSGADVNGDGKVTTKDARTILRRAAKLG